MQAGWHLHSAAVADWCVCGGDVCLGLHLDTAVRVAHQRRRNGALTGVAFGRFLEVSNTTGLLIGAGVVFAYAVFGGMKGVTYTQVAQYCVLITAYTMLYMGQTPEEAFRPFYVPVVEVRRRLALTSEKDFFVRYRHVGQKRQLKYRRKGGVQTKGSDPSLDEPLPRWRALLHRYRTFDPAYAPCRH